MARSSAPRRMTSSITPSAAASSAWNKSSMPRTGWPAAPHDQVAGCEPGTRGWTIVLHKANQQTFSIRQTDGTPQTSGDMRRRDSDTKPDAALRLTLSQAVHSRSESLIRRDRKVEPFAQTMSVQAQQPSLGVDYRAAR